MISLSLAKIWKNNQNSEGQRYRNPKNKIIERLSGKKKKKPKNSLSKVPDEVLVYIFRFLSAQELAKSVALTSKRMGYLWLLSVQNFKVHGKIRKFKEDTVISVIKKFVRLESLDVNNNGSSEDFQLTDKGFLQLAHKYIYSDADTINRQTDSLVEDPLTGEFDFNFDYETHLDSTFDTMSAIDPDMESDDEFDDESTENSLTGSKRIKKKLKLITQIEEKKKEEEMKKMITKEEIIEMYPIIIPEDEKKEEDTNTETSEGLIEDHGYYNSLKHVYYYYPPPIQRSKNQKHERHDSDEHKEPCYGLRTLKSLNVTGCHSLTEKGVNYMTYICQNLEHLNLKGCNKINDKACSFLSEFNNLESLNLTGCTRITDEGIEFLSKMKSKNLQSLDLTFCHQITDEGLKHLSTIKSLTSLDLTCCRKITPKGLQYLIDDCLNLISLNLTGCDQIFLSQLKMKKNDSKIEKLQLMGCKSTSDECMRKLSLWAPNLSDLNIAYSDHVTDIGVDLIITNCSNIKSLNIKRCVKITDKTLKCLSKKENLFSLNVTGCKNISNQGIEYISTMKNLQELGLRRCNLITDDGISYLSTLKHLVHLDLSECNLITKSSIKALCDEISERKLTVDLRNSTLPSSEFLSKLIPQNMNSKEQIHKGLRILKLENCTNMSKEFVDQLQHHYKLTVYYAQDGTL
eukprot:gene4762-8344_t